MANTEIFQDFDVTHWRPLPFPPRAAQHFLNFMQFIFENLAKSYVGAPWRVGALSYGES